MGNFKFNNGIGAYLCSNCNAIIYSGSQISKEIKDLYEKGGPSALPKIFCCDACEQEYERKHPNLTEDD